MVNRIWGLVLMLVSSSPLAFECPRHSADPASDGYGPRSKQYCDGIISVGYAGGGPYLVGFSEGRQEILSADILLRIPKTTLAPPFRIQGVAKDASVAYRLDAELATADDVLRIGGEAALFTSKRIKPSEVAFGGWSEGDARQKKTWMPVRVGTGDQLQVYVRTTEELASIQVRLDDEEVPSPEGPFRASQLIVITVPTLAQGPRSLSIETRPRLQGGKTRTLVERIWVPAPK